jgi:spore coat polysaccharide biosynthesis protein SpsF
MVARHVEAGAEYTRVNLLPVGVTAEVFSAAMLPRLHAELPDPNQSEYLTLWAFNPDRYRCEVLEAPENVRRPNYSLTVDTPDDLALVQRLFAALGSAGMGPSLVDVVAALDADPSYRGIPDDAPVRLPGGQTITTAELRELYAARAARARRGRVSGGEVDGG